MVPPDEAEWLAIYQMISSTLCAALKFKVIIDDEAALLLKDTHGGDIRASIMTLEDEISTRLLEADDACQQVKIDKMSILKRGGVKDGMQVYCLIMIVRRPHHHS
eukprot:GHVH01014223.1.p2 GENE.GHVH01014223.1~~GHVH01014223.1.p2  ORF type:complete len:105 (+),score=23.63 GHVH01014223.1:672-986(+)